jgi:hypothetical protein
MSKYDPQYKWLCAKSARGISIVPATFLQIEMILKSKLPSTARNNERWWANETGATRHVQCKAWLSAGFETRNISLVKQSVEFTSSES